MSDFFHPSHVSFSASIIYARPLLFFVPFPFCTRVAERERERGMVKLLERPWSGRMKDWRVEAVIFLV